MKICTKRKQKKNLKEFSKNLSYTDKLNIYCRDCCAIKRKIYYDKNKNKEKLNHYKYIKNNSSKIKEYNKNYMKHYHKKRLKEDVEYKIAYSLRKRLCDAVRGNYKAGSAVTDLGCTVPKFKLYLEFKFLSGMTWDNWGKGQGKWQIDHILPLSTFDLTDETQVKWVCNYTNLQPLWYLDNARKYNHV